MQGFSGMGMGLGMGFSWLISIVVLAAIIWFFSKMTNTNQQKTTLSHKSAYDILSERYARGEIDKNEYMSKKQDLK